MRTHTALFVVALLPSIAGCGEEATPRPPEERPPGVPGEDPAAARGVPAFEAEGPRNPLNLPDDLHNALRREMVALEPAMSQLQSQLVRGRREEAAQTAKQIHDSFILKQELSADRLRALVASLSPDFVHRDGAFHRTALELAHAAERGDLTEASQLYGQLVDACVACHATHAPTRFPGLEGTSALPPPAAPEGEEPPGHDHAH